MLLDTNIFVDLIRNSEGAKQLIASVQGRAYASVVTLTELMAGARSRREEASIVGLVRFVRLLTVDEAIASRAGQFLKHYAPSHGLDDFDALIAATAEHHGLALATLNVRHFPMFKGLKPAY